MADAVFARTAAYFDDLARRHGADPRASDYGSPVSQRLKFAVLASALDYRGLSVLDVGCGPGAFAAYLAERFEGVRYTGIDLSREAVALARAHHPEHRFEVANVLDEGAAGEHDVVCANGIFYLLGPDAPALVERLVERMWSLARRSLVITALSAWAPDQEPGEHHADPAGLLALAHRLTPWVVLRHDYHHRDVAVFLHRERPVAG